MAEVIPMNGHCPIHNCSKITEDGRPVCLKCMADSAKAVAVPAGVVTIEDPGVEGLASLKPVKSAPTPPQVPVAVPGLTFDEHVARAIDFLQRAPMPGNMAQFKAVASAVKQLQKAITPTQEK